MKTGRASAGVCVPHFKIKLGKRVSDDVGVYSTDMVAIILAVECRPKNMVLCSDSFSASLISGRTETRYFIWNSFKFAKS